MTEPTELPKDPEAAPEASARPDRNRRRLLQGGLGAAPFLTLLSRPVLANTQCFAPSGFISMPTSQHGPGIACAGRTPGYWKQEQHFSSWPMPYFPTKVPGHGGHEATKFVSIFSPSPYAPKTTLLDVLSMDGGPPDDVARHIVATLLNVAAGLAPVLTVPEVMGIWREYILSGGGGSGYFEPTAGVRWYHAEIVDYLVSTMPL